MPELRLDLGALDALLSEAQPRARSNLFAFPAQSNFTGVKHPLDLVARAHDRGWDVVLDAAAFVSTNRLRLREVQPDFVSVSFYKMFGYPTGVGCLLVRKRRSPADFIDRGLPAARSTSRRSRAVVISSRPARLASKTAR